MHSGVLKHNNQGRYEINGSYFTSGDEIEIFSNGKWISGRIEYSYNNADYYFVNEEEGIYIYDLIGKKARYRFC